MTKLRRSLVALAVASTALMTMVGAAHADTPITVGGGWVAFANGGEGSFNVDGAFTFTTTEPVAVTVTDAYCAGDVFRVFVDGVAAGDTSPVTPDPDCVDPYTADPDTAFADPRYSSGTFAVGAGSHGVTIQLLFTPFSGAGGFLRIDAAPLPTPPSKAACKNGGWRSYVDDQGRPFRTQGRCVRFVADRR